MKLLKKKKNREVGEQLQVSLGSHLAVRWALLKYVYCRHADTNVYLVILYADKIKSLRTVTPLIPIPALKNEIQRYSL